MIIGALLYARKSCTAHDYPLCRCECERDVNNADSAVTYSGQTPSMLAMQTVAWPTCPIKPQENKTAVFAQTKAPMHATGSKAVDSVFFQEKLALPLLHAHDCDTGSADTEIARCTGSHTARRCCSPSL